MIHLPKADDCCGCAACVTACSHGALAMVIDANGYFKVETDPQRCTHCTLCERVCPILKTESSTIHDSRYYACWNEDDDLRRQSASGGAFSALASAFLRQGGIVYGAAIDGFDIVHCRVDSLSELPPLLGSKYQPGNLTGVYAQVRKDLLAGKSVLFSGMSCQVAGLKSYLGKSDSNRLYTIDTICGGFSTMLPILALKSTGKYRGIHSFRDKDNGWRSTGFRYCLKMDSTDGSIDNLGLDNMVLNTFSSKLLKRASCLNCQFTSPGRRSDATIGDFWGDKRFTRQHHGGLSIIAIHSDRIRTLLRQSPLHIEEIALDELTRSNHNYYWTRYPLIRKFLSRKLALWAMRNKHWGLARHLMRPKSLAGILMSLYLKFNTQFQRTPFYKDL